MGGLSRTGIGLIVVVVVTLAAFLAQLCYVLWCRRRFHRQNFSGEILNISSSAADSSPSKELLYFFCWKNQSRIGPAASAPTFRSDSAPDESPESDFLVKGWGLYGPSRALFTIKEEDREDLAAESDKNSSEAKKTKARVSLEEHFEAALERDPPAIAATATATAVAVAVAELEKETPFSTPCDSPLYYTPSPSPPRENLTQSPETDIHRT